MMLDLKGFRSKATGLPDLLTYAALIDPGIVLQKDGSFLAAWEMRGPDGKLHAAGTGLRL